MKKLVNKLESNQVIVSGATGFIGQYLVPILLENNYEVIATARDPNKVNKFSWSNNVRFIPLDFHINQYKFELKNNSGLIHLAWQDTKNYKSLLQFEENLPANYRFIKSMVLMGVNQVLVTGTCFEYGLQNGLMRSSTPTFPITPYALAKDSLRKQLLFLSEEYKFNFQWARLFYMYGDGQSPNSLLAKLDTAIHNNDKTFNMSAGEQIRDYLPVEEVAKQIYSLFVSSKAGIFNICSGNPISVRRLVEERINKRNAKIEINFGSIPYVNYEPMAFWGERDIN